MAGLERYPDAAGQEEIGLWPPTVYGGRGDQQVLRFRHDWACVSGRLRLKRGGFTGRFPPLTQAILVDR